MKAWRIYLEYLGQESWECMVIKLVLWLTVPPGFEERLTTEPVKKGAFVKIYMLTYTYHLLLGAHINYISLQSNVSTLLLLMILYLCRHISFLFFSHWHSLHLTKGSQVWGELAAFRLRPWQDSVEAMWNSKKKKKSCFKDCYSFCRKPCIS